MGLLWTPKGVSNIIPKEKADFLMHFCHFFDNFGVAVIKSAASAASPEGILQPT